MLRVEGVAPFSPKSAAKSLPNVVDSGSINIFESGVQIRRLVPTNANSRELINVFDNTDFGKEYDKLTSLSLKNVLSSNTYPAPIPAL